MGMSNEKKQIAKEWIERGYGIRKAVRVAKLQYAINTFSNASRSVKGDDTRAEIRRNEFNRIIGDLIQQQQNILSVTV
jgi:hypothetical protein